MSGAVMRPQGSSLAILVLAMCGIAVSAISLSHHYRTSDTAFCSFGDNFDCDIVNRSIYSEVFDVPVALIGLLGYAALGALALSRSLGAAVMLLAGALGGLAFALYLTYIEAYILAVWCVLCLASLALITLITALAAARMRRGARLQHA